MYAILDIESTGGKYNEEGIMEIAIHRFDGHQKTDTFISLINPEREIQPFVAKLTGINSKMLRSAPKFHEVAKRIIEITDQAVIVAHNAQFDYRILRTEFRRLGYDYQRKTLCTVALSKKLLPEAESHSLGKLVRSLGIPMSDRHRANGDALATVKLFKILLAKDTDKSILKEVLREESLGELSPNQLDMVKSLPEETGVYYLYSKEGEIIFLGKTKNLRNRVNQHFTNTSPVAYKLQKETKKVDFELTGGELMALLKEAIELQHHKPKHNPKVRQHKLSHYVVIQTSSKGYHQLQIVTDFLPNMWHISFVSLEQANRFLQKLSDTHGTRIISGEIAAAHKQLPEEHNAWLAQILNLYSLYKRTFLILDKGRTIGERGVIYIKNGLVSGMGYVDLNHQINNIPILETIITNVKGDQHTTHRIENYLRKKHRLQFMELNQNP